MSSVLRRHLRGTGLLPALRKGCTAVSASLRIIQAGHTQGAQVSKTTQPPRPQCVFIGRAGERNSPHAWILGRGFLDFKPLFP